MARPATAQPCTVPRRLYGTGREALLDATITIVAQRGLRRLTYRAVAAEAGVTHGLVAHHFGSRDALLLAALHHSVQRAIDVTHLQSPDGSVEGFLNGLVAIVDQDPDLHAFQYEVLLDARRNPLARDHAEELLGSYREATRRSLSTMGIRDEALADLVFAALDGLVFQQITVGSTTVTADALNALRRLLVSIQQAA